MHRLFSIICTSHLPTAFTAILLVVLYGLVLWLPPLAAQASKTPEFVETSETLKQSGDIDLHRTQDIQSMSPDSLDDTDTSPEAANAIFNSGFRLSLEEGLQTDTVIKYMMIASSLLLLTGYWVWVLRREI